MEDESSPLDGLLLLSLMAFNSGERMVLAGKPAVDLENHRLGTRFSRWMLMKARLLMTPLGLISRLLAFRTPVLEAVLRGLRCIHARLRSSF